MKELKQRTIRGGMAKLVSQAANFLLRIGSLMVLARILTPKDFGLVGMVTAVIGVFSVFRDFGLSAAAVQRDSITPEQSSTLFWINLLAGVALGLIGLVMAPFIAAFYHEPRLLGVTAILSTAFVFNAAGVQHAAILERQMRFTTLSLIEIVSLSISTAAGIGMAMHGLGYWSLVVTATGNPLIYMISVWLVTRWVPGMPRRGAGVLSMLRFGSTLTLNMLVMYLASNLDKVFLGRFWGAETLGIYGRAYQLINIPTDNLNASAGGVVFAALSRLHAEPERLRSYFLKGYSLVLSLTIPIAFTCAIFASEMIRIFLGPKWTGAIEIFRLLAPVSMAFAILNPLGWLLSALGLVNRGLKMALVLAPAMIASYLVGIHYGPKGVAICYSSVMLLAAVPMMAWATRGTSISMREMLITVGRPFFSGIVAATIALAVGRLYTATLLPLPRLLIGTSVLFGVYLVMLFFAMGQRGLYLDILRSMLGRSSSSETYITA